LVLDEADRMLELGYGAQLKAIISQVRPDRQTMMFSATWPMEVRQFAKKYHTKPVFLNVGSMDVAANHNIVQHIEVITEQSKPKRLSDIINKVLAKVRLN
jgi:superfamily II DNA/RNA helicase